jgi:hypothetical protein
VDGTGQVARIAQYPETGRLLPGERLRFSVFLVGAGGDSVQAPSGAVAWDVSGGTVDAGGTYTAGGVSGLAEVVASYDAGRLRDTSSVVVEGDAAVATVELVPSSGGVLAGGQRELRPIFRNASGVVLDGIQPRWRSSDETIATVSAEGVVSGLRAGRVAIVAETGDRSGSAEVFVTEPQVTGPSDIIDLSFDDPAAFGRLTVPGGLLFPTQTQWHLLDATGGRSGSAAMRIEITPGDRYEPLGPQWPARSRVFVRYYFRTSGAGFGQQNVASFNVKGPRFHFQGGNLGVLKSELPLWGFDEEAGAVQVGTGMYWARQPGPESAYGIVPTCENLSDGRWHWIEMDYDRSAGSNVEIRFWCDGRAVVLPNGPASWGGSAWPQLQYVGGNRATNTPTTLRAARVGPSQVTDVTLFETISQGFSGTIWVDDVAVSSQRIGP